MKLAILGGGGFRVPLVYQALLGSDLIDEVTLCDSAPLRLATIERVLRQIPGADRIRLRATTSLAEALPGADFVFSAVRVGGVAGRVRDERIALESGVLGQETTGAGGLAYALRTVPVAVQIAEAVRRLAPAAFVVNFTNPAGIVTEAMQTLLGDRVVGICDTPSGLAHRTTALLGLLDSEVEIDYVGLNHLGWLRRIVHQGIDRLPELLADDMLLGQLDEAGMFGPDWLRMLGAVPNEYLYYYYYQREARQSIEAAAQTRGEYLRDQQSAFYRESAQQPQEARRLWQAALAQREATYLSESREAHEERHSVGGGYEQVALAVMTAIAGDASTRLILNVANGTTISGLDASAVVEVPCLVDASGAHPQPTPPVSAEHLGLMQQVKAVERLTIEAAATRSAETATRALALHPLVDSVAVARILTRRYGDAFDLFD